jgi:hypothetical protein
MNSKLISGSALFLCAFTFNATVQSAPIFSRNTFENTSQENVQDQSVAAFASTINTGRDSWIEAWFLGVMPTDARAFLRAAMELAPARFAVNSEATISFRTIARP